MVVGLGPGGEHAAIKLGRAGLDVVAVENRLVGGECPFYGCMPSKMMIAGRARSSPTCAGSPDFAGDALVRPDWSLVARRVRRRPPTTGTTRRPSTGSLDQRRAVRPRPRPARRPGPRGGGRHDVRRLPRRPAQHRHRPGRAADRRARRHAVLDQPRRGGARPRCRRRWSWWAAVRSAASSPRSSRGSACGSPSSRWPTGCSSTRSRRPPSCLETALAAERASRC